MRRIATFLVILNVVLLVFIITTMLRPQRGTQLFLSSESITVRFRFPPGWSESDDGVKNDLDPGGLWSPAFVDADGRYITFYIGNRGDLYWRYLFEFREYERSEDLLIDGESAKLWIAKDGSFVVIVTAGSVSADEPVEADRFLAVAGNGSFSQEIVGDLLAQLTITIRLPD